MTHADASAVTRRGACERLDPAAFDTASLAQSTEGPLNRSFPPLPDRPTALDACGGSGARRGRPPRGSRRAAPARGGPVAALQRQRDQVVGQPGVLGQQRAVQVGADQVVAPDALEAVAAVVAVALDDAAERTCAPGRGRCGRRGSRSRRAAAARRRGRPRSRRCRSAAGPARAPSQVGEAEAGQPLLAELVAVAEQLVAAADGEQDGAVFDRRRPAPRACSRPCRRRPPAGRGPGRRRCRRGRGRPGRPTRPARRRRRRSRCPRHSQRRCRKTMLPRSA